MKINLVTVKSYIANCLVTTAVALIILSIVALLYGGSLICISTIFETLLLSVLIQLSNVIISAFEIINLYLHIILKYAVAIILALGLGFIFHWFDNISPVVLSLMTILTYFLCFKIELSRIQSDILEINSKL